MFALRLLKRVAIVIALLLLGVLALRIFASQRGRPLARYHEFVPEELRASDLAQADWEGYLAAEEAALASVRREVTEKLAPAERVAINRYYDGSPMYPGRFATDWNRSFALDPEGEPAGAMVFLHGLTDAPYSGREIARRYQAHGFASVVIRLPGHGTVPAGLVDVTWEDWAAAARLAVREAVRRGGAAKPLHVIGYSNGGALALQIALDALDDASLTRPARLVLISPMIGVTRFARFAGVAGWPAVLPAFAGAAWLGIEPEFNPFKYNSFPVNAARQTHLLTDVLQRQIERQAGAGRWSELPPIQTFQSVVDSTVSTRAIVTALYARLPANGSELVLYDVNRSVKLGPLLRPGAEAKLSALLPPAPRAWRTVVVANAAPGSREIAARETQAGATEDRVRPLDLAFPDGVFSLSHIALPFPADDPLYGLSPDPGVDFGVRLGALALRGERGVLATNPGSLLRLTSNPFFAWQMARIEENLGPAR